MFIKTTKGNFKKVPTGKQVLYITDVKLVPSGKPQMVEFYYSHESGATLKETLKFNHPVASDILGQRVDTLYNGTMKEGTEIDTSDLPTMFNHKGVNAFIKHVEGKTDGELNGKIYVNIGYVESYFEYPKTVDEEADDDL